MPLHIDNKYIRFASTLLRNFKQKKENLYNFSCPFCGDSKTNSHKARGYMYDKSDSLLYICHNCGHTTNLQGVLEQVSGTLKEDYVMEVYMEKYGRPQESSEESNQKLVNQAKKNTRTPRKKVSQKLLDIQEKQKFFEYAEFIKDLPENHYAKEYIRSRKIPEKHFGNMVFTENYKKFVEAIYPEASSTKNAIREEPRIGILIYDSSGTLQGVYGRAMGDSKLRYATIRLTDSKEKLLFGIDRVDKNKPIIVLEGAFDSMFLDNAVAAGTSNLKITADYLVKLGYPKENLILLHDNQPRKKEIVGLVKKAIDADYYVSFLPDTLLKDGKDINEYVLSGVSSEKIQKMILENSKKGIGAQLEFVNWKKV